MSPTDKRDPKARSPRPADDIGDRGEEESFERQTRSESTAPSPSSENAPPESQASVPRLLDLDTEAPLPTAPSTDDDREPFRALP